MLVTSLATMNQQESEQVRKLQQAFAGKSLLQHDKEAFMRVRALQKRGVQQNLDIPHTRVNGNKTQKSVKLKHCVSKISSVPKKDLFQPVGNSQAFIYSAFLDKRDPGQSVIRIIGVGPRLDKQRYFCLLAYSNENSISVPAISDQMYVDDNLHAKFKYLPYFYICDVTGMKEPTHVSLTSRPCSPPKNAVFLTKIDPIPEKNIPEKLALCMRTLYSITSPYIVIEFMEIQKELGVDKIFLYGIENVGSEVGRVLDYYVSTGYVQVIPWSLPVTNAANFWQKGHIGIHGQRASNNDCLYRNMNKYKILLMHDLDEYFVPRRKNNLKSLVEYFEETYKSNQPPAAFDFKNCYFCLEEDDISDSNPRLLTMKKHVRDDCMPRELAWTIKHHPELKHRETNRTVVKKSLVYAHRVQEMGVHGVVKTLPGYKKQEWVPPETASMHHYKRVQGVECHRMDKTMSVNYNKAITDRANKVINNLGMKPIK